MSSTLQPTISAYVSPIDFRIGQAPPQINTIVDANLAITDLYAFAQQVIRTFVDVVGIGPQVSTRQKQLAGSSTTITTGDQHRLYVQASEAIQFGAMISLFGNSGVLNVRNANSTNATRVADGFCSTVGGIAAGAVGEVVVATGVAIVGGLVIGSRYWLSPTNGVVQNVPDTAAGHIEQYLGIAIDTGHLFVNTHMWLQH